MINVADRLSPRLTTTLAAFTWPELLSLHSVCTYRTVSIWLLSAHLNPKNVNLPSDHTITRSSLAHCHRNTLPSRTPVKQHAGVWEACWAEPHFCQLRCLSSNLTSKENPNWCDSAKDRCAPLTQNARRCTSDAAAAPYPAMLEGQHLKQRESTRCQIS